MKSRFYVSILFVAAYFLGVGNNMTAKQSTLSPQTQKDLVTAMHRDAFAYAKYMLYVAQAREMAAPTWLVCLRKQQLPNASRILPMKPVLQVWAEMTPAT
jgi:hypothetical protein